ncbi:MAG TPA: histidine kinase dimerization/phospho-acceptor domain-containing protein, partial [Marmoricola sp.]|nr:histidine kinase dimerization/phospho-acceptor domain-containing protein [Marmoricola sp.]
MSSSQQSEEATPIRHRRLIPRLPHSLTGRLVALVVVLVAVVGLMVAGATAFAMRNYLRGQLDNSLSAAYQHEADAPSQFIQSCQLGTSTGGPRGFAQGPGTLIAHDGCNFVVSNGSLVQLTNTQVDELNALTRSANPQSVELDGLGHYRVIVANGIAVGLPLHDVDNAVRNLGIWELALTLTGVLFAGMVGTEIVRRQLRPLREVAAAAHEVTGQQLAKGTPSIDIRVADRNTDPETEVGRVGAALNTLLDHVDEALTARHLSEQRVRRFVADASHELRTPLATIQGYAELTRRSRRNTTDGEIDAAAYEAIISAFDKVETEAGRMAGLVEDLLLLARLDSGRPLEREEVDVTRLTLEAISDARVVDSEHQWRLDLPDEPLSVWGDEPRLHQVITNLLTNARKHTPPGTTVTVGSRRLDASTVLVTVHDDGPGLPAELVPRVFERFSRGD